MTTLIINDLPLKEELDSKEMSAVRGGMHQGVPHYWGALFDLAKSDFHFTPSQMLAQSQGTVVNNGNNAAFVSGTPASATPAQPAFNALLPNL